MADAVENPGRSNRYVLRQVDRLFSSGTLAGQPDTQLLWRFTARNDQAAFEVLIERHGPMVLSVCRRWLRYDATAVEDAFQATFLILVQKARTLRNRDRLAAWLYGVALRVARRARQQDIQRETGRRHDLELGDLPRESESDFTASCEQDEIATIVDEEMTRLPARQRDPMVLCYLQGLTHEQAADRLRWPVGTVRSRMASARETLRTRLTRRGVVAPAALAGAAVGARAARAAQLSPALIESTARLAVSASAKGAAAGAIPAAVATLTTGVLRTMTLQKWAIAAGIVVACAATTGAGIAGSALLTQQAGRGGGRGGQRPSGGAETARLQAENDNLRMQNEQLRLELRALQDQLAVAKLNDANRLAGHVFGQTDRTVERRRALIGSMEAARQELWVAESEGKQAEIAADLAARRDDDISRNVVAEKKEREEFYQAYKVFLEKRLAQLEEQLDVADHELAMIVKKAAAENADRTSTGGGAGRGGGGLAGGDAASGGAGLGAASGEPGRTGDGVTGGMGPAGGGMGAMMMRGGMGTSGGNGGMMGAGGRGAAAGGEPGGGGGAAGGMGAPGGVGGGSGAAGMGSMMGMMGGGMMPGGGMSAMLGGGGAPAGSSAVMSSTITVVQPKGSDRIMAHSTETGVWKPYRVPQGVTATPIVTSDLLALQLEGENVTQLAVFTPADGAWSVRSLKEPTSGPVVPVSSGRLVVYTVGNRVYAFSGLAGRWDVLELEAPAPPTISTNRIFVESGGKLCIFSDTTGQWSIFDSNSEKDAEPAEQKK